MANFLFAGGKLPVRYLGLPLLNRKMTVSHYLSLMEKIRSRICNWNVRFLPYAGELQLIDLVIMSLTNFWLSAFRLLKQCLTEIERLCAASLWSGPELSGKCVDQKFGRKKQKVG